MKIRTMNLHSYQIPLNTGLIRSGVLIHLIDEEGRHGWGEVAPLTGWSKETLKGSSDQLLAKKQALFKIDWTADGCFQELGQLSLYPSVTFGLESALLSILAPLPGHEIATSALLMGSPEKIMEEAERRLSEGFTSAKLKVGTLSFDEASRLIHRLKDTFHLRIDVNRAWETEESLRFFSQFTADAFDYVEEPFKNPKDLMHFRHPLAVDESFPQDLSLEELDLLPTLKALIYKPTIQGGMLGCMSLLEWAQKRGISIVLSSCFESDLGIAHIASLAYRLSLSAPVGIGTYHYLADSICEEPLRFSLARLHIPLGGRKPSCNFL